MPILNSIAASNVGKVRESNEDNFFLNGKTLNGKTQGTAIESHQTKDGLFAVCDGMGGEAQGELAAAIAVISLGEYYYQALKQERAFDKWFGDYVMKANAQICAEIEKNSGKRMGTTFAVLSIQDQQAYSANIGDSRVYLFRGGQIRQLSKDHTQARRLIDMGILTEEEGKTHPERHKLTQHLGIFPEEMIIEPFFAPPVQLEAGDVFLLCSDGLTDMVEDEEIQEILSRHENPRDAARSLMDIALENGGKDNVSLIISKVCH